MDGPNFEKLPYDIFEHLCSFLNLDDLQNVMLTCKTWHINSFNKYVSDKILIKLCKDDYTDETESSKIKQIINSDRYFSAIAFHDLKVTDLLKEFLLKFGSQIRKLVIYGVDIETQFEFFSIFDYVNDIRSFDLFISDSLSDLFNISKNYKYVKFDDDENEEIVYNEVGDDDAVSVDEQNDGDAYSDGENPENETEENRNEENDENNENANNEIQNEEVLNEEVPNENQINVVNEEQNLENNNRIVIEYDREPLEEDVDVKFKILVEKEQMEKTLRIFEKLTNVLIYECYNTPSFGKYFIKHFLTRVNRAKYISLTSSSFSNSVWFYNWLSNQTKTLQKLEIADYRALNFLPFSYHFQNLITFKELKLKTFSYQCDLYSYKYFEQFCKTQSSTLQTLIISLHLEFVTNFTIICNNLKNLKKLVFEHPLEVQITENTQCLSQLQKLEFLNIDHIGADETEKILPSTSMPAMKTLYIGHIKNLETYEILGTTFNNLEELRLRTYEPLDLNGIQLIFKHLINLKQLTLQLSYYNDGSISEDVAAEPVCKITNLKKLEVFKIELEEALPIPGITIDDISELENLKELRLLRKHLYNTTFDEYHKLFSKSFNLEVFEIFRSPVLDNFLIELLTKNCKKLKTLSISNCSKLTYKAIDHIVENCKNLKNIQIFNCYRLRQVKEMKRKLKTNHITTVNVVFDSSYKWYK